MKSKNLKFLRNFCLRLRSKMLKLLFFFSSFRSKVRALTLCSDFFFCLVYSDFSLLRNAISIFFSLYIIIFVLITIFICISVFFFMCFFPIYCLMFLILCSFKILNFINIKNLFIYLKI